MRTSLAVVLTALAVAGCSNSSGTPIPSPSASRPQAASPSTPTALPPRPPTTSVTTPSEQPPSRDPSSTFTQPPATADSSTQVFADCHTPVVRPPAITLACADAGVRITAITWREWGAVRAVGTGTLVYDDCTPNCAQGTFHQVPGTTVTLTAPKDVGDGLVVWSLISEDPAPPGDRPGPQTLPLHG